MASVGVGVIILAESPEAGVESGIGLTEGVVKVEDLAVGEEDETVFVRGV